MPAKKSDLPQGTLHLLILSIATQRTPEFGVRVALGATSSDLVGLVLRQSLGMLGAGTVVGACAALGAGRLLQRFVAGVQSMEWATVAAMIGLLLVTGLMASLLPALRAARVDAIDALREH